MLQMLVPFALVLRRFVFWISQLVPDSDAALTIAITICVV